MFCCSRIARHRFVRSLRQWMHSRHCGENSVTTWSPCASESTPSPTRSTTPAPSCPSTVGAYPDGSAPEAVYMSVWHTPHATSRTSTSPARGSARSSSCTTSGRSNSSSTAARTLTASSFHARGGTEREQRPATGHSLELVQAAVRERERAAHDGSVHGARHEHLAGTCERVHARGDVHGHAPHVLADQLALAGVHADAHLDPQLARGGRDRERAAQGARGRPVERRQKAVADRLDLVPAEARA